MFSIDLPVYWVSLIPGTALLLLSIILGDLIDGVFGAVGIDIDVPGGRIFGAGGTSAAMMWSSAVRPAGRRPR